MSDNNKKVLIIGAGVTGLTAGRKLRGKGYFVEILDKGRGIGGRLATRTINTEGIGESKFDYGAQFLTASGKVFSSLKDELIDKNVIRVWSNKLEENIPLNKKETIYYCGVKSMRSIAKYLAADLLIHNSTKISKIVFTDEWTIISEDGKQFSGDYLILTQPVPQILELIDNSELKLQTSLRARLEKISYDPCIAVLAVLNGPSNIKTPGGIKLNGEPISFIADNKIKGISEEVTAVTIHTGPKFSRQNWDNNDDYLVREISKYAENYLGSKIVDYQIHRWKYSFAKTLFANTCVAIEDPGLVILAGDAFAAPKIEGAFLSGTSAAQKLIELTAVN